MSQHLDTRPPSPFDGPPSEPEFIPLYPSNRRRRGAGSGSRKALIGLLCLVVLAGVGLLAHAAMTPVAGSGSVLRSPATAKPKAAPANQHTTPPSKAVLATVNLRQNDLPGWAPDTSSDDQSPDDPKADAQMDKCAPALAAIFDGHDNVDEVDSPDFTLGQQDISSTATSVDSAKDLAADSAAITSPKFLPCFQAAMALQMADSVDPGTTVTSVRVVAMPRYAGEPKSVLLVMRMTVVVHGAAGSVPLYIDDAFVTGRLIEASVTLDSVGQPVAAALEHRAITTVGSRAAAA